MDTLYANESSEKPLTGLQPYKPRNLETAVRMDDSASVDLGTYTGAHKDIIVICVKPFGKDIFEYLKKMDDLITYNFPRDDVQGLVLKITKVLGSFNKLKETMLQLSAPDLHRQGKELFKQEVVQLCYEDATLKEVSRRIASLQEE